MKKKAVFLTLIASVLLFLCSFTTFRQETGQGHANVTLAQTPINTEQGGTIWTRSFPSADGTYSYNSDPVIYGSVIYLAHGSTLYELNKEDGTVLRTHPLSARTDSVCHMLLEGSTLFLPLSGGIIECVDIGHMQTLWQSESFGGQSLSTLFYQDGALYAGTVNMISGTDCTGVFYCLDTSDGHTLWTYEDTDNPGGYYWSGAIVYREILYFAGDNGILVSHSLKTDEIYDTCTLTETSRIRAGLTYDTSTNSLYTVDTSGYLYRIPVTDDSRIDKEHIQSSPAVPGASSLYCTSTPTIYGDRLYIGCLADYYGHISVLDARDLSLIYTVRGEQGAEIKSSPLVSAGFATAENHNLVYVYVSANRTPGGIYYLKDDSTSTSGSLQTLFVPAVAKQFCMSSITCDEQGTLYYSNDSNTLFAVREVEYSSDQNSLPSSSPAPAPTPARQPSPISSPAPSPSPSLAADTTGTSTATGQTTVSSSQRIRKPIKLKIKKKKKKLVLAWTKKTKKSQTIVYIRYKKGSKWKKLKTTSKTNCRITVQKKTLFIRLRSRIRSGSKWIYSGYTKIYRFKQ